MGDQRPQATSEKTVEPADSPAREPIRVLLVEDDPHDAELVDRALARCTAPRFESTAVSTFAAALPIARRCDHDTILLDLSLPDATGLSGVRELALAAPHTAIVILTGLEEDMAAVDAIRHGAQDYLVKGEGSTAGLVRSIQMAIERKRFEAQLAEHANFDQLTGLVNRRLFRDRLAQALARARRRRERAALLYVDLDGFKAVNDRFGHAAGDDVLRLVAERFREAVRESETVARLGGDEFTILVEPLSDRRGAQRAAERVLAALSTPLPLGKGAVRITPSIGIALYPEDAADGDSLLHNADLAMFHAKKAGRNRLQLFDEIPA